jgi:polysaccharide biosynthesis protein PslG
VRGATFQTGRRARALALTLTLTMTGMLAFAASAQALPARFWGAVPQSTLTSEQFQRLAQGGVESIRVPIDWAELQPQRGGPIDWAGTDLMVERAALAGVDLLPAITGAPAWAVPSARVVGGGGSRAPAHLPASGPAAGGWQNLLRQAAERYGPNGVFWSLRPTVPMQPIRTWQIWNEPNFKFFVAKPNPTEYGKLVQLSSTALKSVDPGAKIVLAGLFAQPKGARTATGRHASLNWFASDFLQRMYATTRGVKSRFNGVALHPYSANWQYLTPEIEEVREVLKANHDPSKSLWITELGWSSGPPASDGSNSFAKGPAGQARQLRGAFRLLTAKQAKWRIQRVYWFSVDDLSGSCNFCDGSGLFGPGFTPKKSWFEYVKFSGGTP